MGNDKISNKEFWSASYKPLAKHVYNLFVKQEIHSLIAIKNNLYFHGFNLTRKNKLNDFITRFFWYNRV